MIKYGITELAVCTVCIHLIANGEFDDGTDAAEECGDGQIRVWGDDARHLSFGGEELGFSWQDCDGCGSWLAGDRFAASIMIPLN